jgi:spore coat protein U-like protein
MMNIRIQQMNICHGLLKQQSKRRNTMFEKSILQISLATVLLSASSIVLAASMSTNLPVSASVSQNCLISTTSAIAFGAYDPVGVNALTALNTSGQISIACAKKSVGLTIGMDNGVHVSGAQRQMLGAANAENLQYNLYQPPSNTPNTACTFPGTVAWSTSGGGLLNLASPVSKAANLYNVCGTIPAGQDVSVDTYTDTIIATINF